MNKIAAPNEFWVNVYNGMHLSDSLILFGSKWESRKVASEHTRSGGRRLIYRIHVKMKDTNQQIKSVNKSVGEQVLKLVKELYKKPQYVSIENSDYIL